MKKRYDAGKREPPAVQIIPGKRFLHDFRFEKESRKMVCERCGGVMNECPALCGGRPAV